MEEQLAPARAQGRRWRIWLVAMVIIGVAFFGLSGFLLYKRTVDAHTPLPASLVQSVSFPVYYPDKLPKDYFYKEGSATVDQGVFFYTLTNGHAMINIGQQFKPTDFNFDTFVATVKDFKQSESSVGKAYSGVNGSTPVTMIVGKQTFITITGTVDISSESVGTIAKSLR